MSESAEVEIDDLPAISPSARIQPGAMSYDALDNVLGEIQWHGEELDCRELARFAEALDRQLALMAAVGPSTHPEQFPSEAHRLSYWLNARAAWSLEIARRQGCKEVLDLRRYLHQPFVIDGRTMTLSRIGHLLADCSDPRAEIIVPGVRVQEARMIREPFRADNVMRRIDERFNAFMADEDRMRIDVEAQVIYYPPGMWRRRQCMVEAYEKTYDTTGASLRVVLMTELSGRAMRRLQDAVGYAEKPAPQNGRTHMF